MRRVTDTASNETRAAAAAQAVALRLAAEGRPFSHLAVAGALRGGPHDQSPSEVWRALMDLDPSVLARDPASGYFHAPARSPDAATPAVSRPLG